MAVVRLRRQTHPMALMLSPNTGYMTNLSSMKEADVIQTPRRLTRCLLTG